MPLTSPFTRTVVRPRSSRWISRASSDTLNGRCASSGRSIRACTVAVAPPASDAPCLAAGAGDDHRLQRCACNLVDAERRVIPSPYSPARAAEPGRFAVRDDGSGWIRIGDRTDEHLGPVKAGDAVVA